MCLVFELALWLPLPACTNLCQRNRSDFQTDVRDYEAEGLGSELERFSVPLVSSSIIFLISEKAITVVSLGHKVKKSDRCAITERAISIPELYNVCLLVFSSLQFSMKLLCPCRLLTEKTGTQSDGSSAFWCVTILGHVPHVTAMHCFVVAVDCTQILRKKYYNFVYLNFNMSFKRFFPRQFIRTTLLQIKNISTCFGFSSTLLKWNPSFLLFF